MASARYQAACVSHGRRAFQPLYRKFGTSSTRSMRFLSRTSSRHIETVCSFSIRDPRFEDFPERDNWRPFRQLGAPGHLEALSRYQSTRMSEFHLWIASPSEGTLVLTTRLPVLLSRRWNSLYIPF